MKLCLFSVSYAGFWGQHALSLNEFIAQSAKTGLRFRDAHGKTPASGTS